MKKDGIIYLILLVPALLIACIVGFFEQSVVLTLLIFVIIVLTLPLITAIRTKQENESILNNLKKVAKKKLTIFLMMRMYLVMLVILVATYGILYMKDYILEILKNAVDYNNFDIYSDGVGFVSQLDYMVDVSVFVLILAFILFFVNYFYYYYLITLINDNRKTIHKKKKKKKKQKEIKSPYLEFKFSKFLYIVIIQFIVISYYVVNQDKYIIGEVFHPKLTASIYFLVILVFIYTTFYSLYVFTYEKTYKKQKLIGLMILVILTFSSLSYVSTLEIENVEINYDTPEEYAEQIVKYSDINTSEDANIISNLLYTVYINDISQEVSESIDSLEIETETKINPIYGDLLSLYDSEVEYVYLNKVDTNIFQFQTDESNIYISSSTEHDSSTVYDLVYHSNIADYLLQMGENPYWLSDSSREACAFEIDNDCNTEVPILVTNIETYDVINDNYSTRFVDSNETISQNILKQLAAFDVYFYGSDANEKSLEFFSNKEDAKAYIIEYDYIYIHVANIIQGYDYEVADFEKDLEINEGDFKVLMDNIYAPDGGMNYKYLLKNYNDYKLLFNATNIRATEGQ